jgi:hypothetical protein
MPAFHLVSTGRNTINKIETLYKTLIKTIMRKNRPVTNLTIRITVMLFACIFYFPLSAQTHNKFNLEKYWRYRERLKRDYLVVSHTNTSGTNIPAVDLYLSGGGKSVLSWGDANSNMSHYIGMLATEYRLLKNSGGNYQETLTELYYALNAINRLDQNSESNFRPDHSVGGDDWNGWMIRDDVDQNFWNTYHSQLGFDSADPGHYYSVSNPNTSGGYYLESVSQDNIYHLFEALGLVKALVENQTIKLPGQQDTYVNFQLWVKAIALRSIQMMQHNSAIYLMDKNGNHFQCGASKPTWWQWALSPDWAFLHQVTYEALCSIRSKWYIQNPVTNELAFEGSGNDFDTWLYFCYGAARAGNKIMQPLAVDLSMDPSNGSLQQETFHSILDGSYATDAGVVSALFAETLGMAVVHFVAQAAGVPPGTIPPGVASDIVYKIVGDAPPIDPYKVKTLAAVGKIGGDNTFWLFREDERERYLHFQLMYAAMHGAPASYSPSSSEYLSDKSYYESFLALAPCMGPRSYRLNGGDDYSDEWSSSSRLVWPENRRKEINNTVEYNGLDYMLLHNLYCLAYGQDFRRLTVNVDADFAGGSHSRTAVDIIGENVISSSTTVSYVANHSVRLIPGFQAQAGSTFNATIVPSTVDYAGYSQLNVCNNVPVSGRMATASLSPPAKMNPPVHEKHLVSAEEKSALEVYPNPANGIFVVKLLPNPVTLDNATITVTDVTGIIVRQQSFSAVGEAIDLTGVAKGVYVVTVATPDRNFKSKVVIH